jgi:hypothetical protein
MDCFAEHHDLAGDVRMPVVVMALASLSLPMMVTDDDDDDASTSPRSRCNFAFQLFFSVNGVA